MKASMKPHIWTIFTSLTSIACLSGCALFGGGTVTKVTRMENGVTNTTETATVRRSLAFGDAVQSVAKVKAGNTKTGNSVGVTGLNEETTLTNVPAILKSGGEAFGNAYRAAFGLPPAQ